MALTTTTTSDYVQVLRLPQGQYIDSARWLPQLSAFDRHIVLASSDPDASTASLQILNLNPKPSYSTPNPPDLSLQSNHPTPSRITSLKTSSAPKPIVAASTFSGSLLFFSADLINGCLDFEASVAEKGFHCGPISGIDVSENGSECVTVGEDGRVNLVSIVGKGLSFGTVFDSNGLVSYSAVKWASPVEFVTGGLGFSLHWWDQRRPGGPVSHFKGSRIWTNTSGIIHSVDIHPSRMHTCLAGGSSGTVFAWDLRWQNQPIVLSGVGTSGSLSETDVWEVKYDSYIHSTSTGNFPSSRILPAMICSEDGILAVLRQDEEPVELLAEPCAINSFDIDRQNPGDVICSLEWESVAVVTRS